MQAALPVSHPPAPRASGLIPVALLAGVYVLIVVVVCGCVAVGAWVVGSSASTGTATRTLVFLGITVVAVLSGAFVSFRKGRNAPARGLELTPIQQPQLWSVISELAQAVATRPPDEIRLVAEVNASVREDSSWLGLRGGRRILFIGAPLLIGLTAGQLKAILGHELGHYSGRHTRTTLVTIRGRETLARIIKRTDNPLVRPLFTSYARLYERVSAGVRRAHEAQADSVAIAVCGRAESIGFLRRLPTLDMAWDLVVDRYAPLAGRAGRTPDVFSGFSALLAEPARSQLYERATDAALTAPSRPYDTHPALGERIALAMTRPDTTVPADDRPAWSLVAHLPQTLRQLQDSFLRADLGPDATWFQVAELFGRQYFREAASTAAKLAVDRQLPPTLDGLLGALARGQGAEFIRPLVNPGVSPQKTADAFRSVLTSTLSEVADSALIESGRARCTLNWAGPEPWRLVGRDGGDVDTAALIAPAVAAMLTDAPGTADPAAVAYARDQLASLGVPLDRPLPTADADSLRPELIGIAAAVSINRRKADLLVCTTGVMIAPMSTKDSWVVRGTSGWSRGKVNRKRLKTLLDPPLEQVLAVPGNRFIGTHDIASATVGNSTLKVHYVLQLQDGSTVKITIDKDTEQIGEALPSLSRMLGARLSRG